MNNTSILNLDAPPKWHLPLSFATSSHEPLAAMGRQDEADLERTFKGSAFAEVKLTRTPPLSAKQALNTSPGNKLSSISQ
jgi:hypothetical protein